MSDTNLTCPPVSAVLHHDPHAEIVTVTLPGILARVGQQFRPVLPQLPGTVVGFTSVGPTYDHGQFIAAVASAIRQDIEAGKIVSLVGSSMAGMQIPFIVDELRCRGVDLTRLGKIVLIDAPTGAETLKEIPSNAVGIMRSGTARRMMSSRLGDWVLGKRVKPPKAEEIDIPPTTLRSWIARRPVDRTDWVAFIQNAAREQLSGWPGSLWIGQVQWMLAAGNGPLARAASGLRGLDVTYMACVHAGNVTVKQPAGANWWKSVAGAKVLTVNAVHCGFWQQPERFVPALRKIFG